MSNWNDLNEPGMGEPSPLQLLMLPVILIVVITLLGLIVKFAEWLMTLWP